MLGMKNLERCFYTAKEKDQRFIAVVIEMEGFNKPEVIINQKENIDTKLEYYKKTYDGNLNHKFAKGIRIIACTYGDTYGEIEYDLFDIMSR